MRNGHVVDDAGDLVMRAINLCSCAELRTILSRLNLTTSPTVAMASILSSIATASAKGLAKLRSITEFQTGPVHGNDCDIDLERGDLLYDFTLFDRCVVDNALHNLDKITWANSHFHSKSMTPWV
jgi:hypothetical protein